MPSFKPKANKKIMVSKKSNVTVDSKHQEKMKEFKNIEDVIIPKLKRERNKLVRRFENKRYARLKKSVGSDAMGLRIQKFMDDFDKYKLDYQNRLANKQKGGKKRKTRKRKRKRKRKKRRRRTRKR